MATLAAALFLLGMLYLGLRWLERSVTFHPVGYSADWTKPAAARDVWFTTKDRVRLHGWFFDAREQPAQATVIYFHGNGGNITDVGWVGERLMSKGFAVLLFDYRGYGRSEGKVKDEAALYADAHAAYELITRDTSADSLVLYGQSLGTTAVVELASQRRCGAIVLESGLSSATEMAKSVLPWFPRSLSFVLQSQFDSVRKLRDVKIPVLVTHGDPDPVIPTEQGRQLFAAANEPKKLLIFPGAGHNVFGTLGQPYLDQVTQFIRESLSLKKD